MRGNHVDAGGEDLAVAADEVAGRQAIVVKAAAVDAVGVRNSRRPVTRADVPRAESTIDHRIRGLHIPLQPVVAHGVAEFGTGERKPPEGEVVTFILSYRLAIDSHRVAEKSGRVAKVESREDVVGIL